MTQKPVKSLGCAQENKLVATAVLQRDDTSACGSEMTKAKEI